MNTKEERRKEIELKNNLRKLYKRNRITGDNTVYNRIVKEYISFTDKVFNDKYLNSDIPLFLKV